jgi:hypothetical protein
MCKQAERAAYSVGVSRCIIERLFLPRKPGVCAYAAESLVARYSLMTPQQKVTARSLVGWMVMFMDQV